MNADQWCLYHAYRAALPVDVRIAIEWEFLRDAYVVSMQREDTPLTLTHEYPLQERVQLVPNLRLAEQAADGAGEAEQWMEQRTSEWRVHCAVQSMCDRFWRRPLLVSDPRALARVTGAGL